MDLHRGTLEAYSQGKNRGSTFTIRIPTIQYVPYEHEHSEEQDPTIESQSALERTLPQSVLKRRFSVANMTRPPPVFPIKSHSMRLCNSMPSNLSAMTNKQSSPVPTVSILRVLLVEDNKSTLMILSRLLQQRLGYHVFSASSVRYVCATSSLFLSFPRCTLYTENNNKLHHQGGAGCGREGEWTV